MLSVSWIDHRINKSINLSSIFLAKLFFFGKRSNDDFEPLKFQETLKVAEAEVVNPPNG